jgi:hypothetical protein
MKPEQVEMLEKMIRVVAEMMSSRAFNSLDELHADPKIQEQLKARIAQKKKC